MSEIFANVDVSPQMTKRAYGPEPTLRELLVDYYMRGGFSERRAKSLAEKYIAIVAHPNNKDGGANG